MHIFSTSIYLLLSATAALSSQVDTVYNDITSLDQDVKNLITVIQAYTGGLLNQGPLLLDLTQVHVATRKGYTDSTSLPSPLSESDTLRIVEHVNTTLAVDNPAAVKVLESKKSLFDASGSTPFIKEGLQVLLDDHLAFSNEVLERTPDDLVAEVTAVVDVISVALQNGIAAFS